jgi:response regulator NasT
MSSTLPSACLRVLLAQCGAARAQVLEQALAAAGHRVVCTDCALRALADTARRLQPDVVIVAVDVVGDDTLAHIDALSEHAPRPVVLFTADADPGKIRAALRCGVTSYVVDGFAPERIAPLLHVALARFELEQAVKTERDAAQSRLAERKLIERAKGILMRKRGIGEDEAYHALRRLAMDRNMRMREVAERLITMSDLLG